MLIKLIFIIIFIFIIISLGFALFNIVRHKDQDHSARTAKALTYRIGISLVLFILLFIAYTTGMIKPHGIGARINQLQHQEQMQTK